jgi:hypothetical protein
MARFTIWSHRYVQMVQMSQDMDNYIFGSAEAKDNQTKVYSQSNATIG